ncbi:MAG: tetratricopeptide repeat protein [Proteobacteria bacterium]|nr:tetratricopeptide repeat protein [Pseudomonadota bacterium]
MSSLHRIAIYCLIPALGLAVSSGVFAAETRPVLSVTDLGAHSATDADGFPTGLPDKGELLRMLRDGNFAALDTSLEWLQTAYEGSFRREDWVFEGFDAFATPEPSLTPRFNEWVAGRGSWPAHLARAIHREARAWEHVGGRFDAQPNAEAVAELRRRYKPIVGETRHALRLRPRLVVAHRILATEARLRGDHKERNRRYDAAVDECPNSFRLRAEYMRALLPHWGGSESHMKKFAAFAQRKAGRNPRMERLRGFIDWQRGLAASDPDRAMQYLNAAVKRGGQPLFLAARAEAHRGQGQLELALADLDLALAERPQHPILLERRARVRTALGQSVAAKSDLVLANQLKTGRVPKTRPAAPAATVAKAEPAPKARPPALAPEMVKAEPAPMPETEAVADESKSETMADKARAKGRTRGDKARAKARKKLQAAESEPAPAETRTASRRPAKTAPPAAAPSNAPADANGKWGAPADFDAMSQADALAKRGMQDKAFAVLEKALNERPDDMELYRAMDRLIEPSGAWDRSVSYWSRYLKRNPDSADALYERSGSYYRGGNLVAAFQDLERACGLGHSQACTVQSRFKAMAP